MVSDQLDRSLNSLSRSTAVGSNILSFPSECLIDRMNREVKQGWRILRFQNSLVSRVLKAKSFPNSSFLEAKLGSGPSYLWRSIWQGRGLLMQGLCWRVGNGDSIKIWHDQWLPVPYQFKVISQNLFRPEVFKSALLLENPCWWNTGLLQGIFCQRDVEIIEKIPLAQEPVEDRLIWHYSVDGELTVKTAYRMGMKFLERCQSQGEAPTSSRGARGSFWAKFLKIYIPPKVKV